MLLKYNSTVPTRINITTPSSLSHFSLLFSSMFTQFLTPYPFIDISYKALTLLLCIISLFSIINKSSPRSALACLCLIPFILISSRLSCLFTYTPQTTSQILQDFYTLPILYTLFLAVIIKFDTPILKRIVYTLSILLIFMSFVRIAYALKVWKFGFDAELKLSERIITRLEKMPNFNIEKKYKLLQIGSIPMRSRYYVNKNKDQNNELLDYSYYEPKNSYWHSTSFIKQTS